MQDSGLKWEWRVPKSEHGRRIDLTLAKWGPENLTRSQIQRKIEKGEIQVNGLLVKSNTRVQENDIVTVLLPPPERSEVEAEDLSLRVLYEDSHLVAIDKPQGMTVHPTPHQKTGTLVNALLHQIKDLSGIGGVLRPGIVHRLDKDTSGVLVVSKTDEAHLGLSELFSKHNLSRQYWALCYGVPKENQGTLQGLIGRNPNDRKKMTLLNRGGKKAITHFRVLEKFATHKEAFASLIELTLETGRTHQIRVQLTALGHSILGDPIYGKPNSKQEKWKKIPQDIRETISKLPGQALHARTLDLIHPITQVPLHISSEPPEPFQELLNRLRNDYANP